MKGFEMGIEFRTEYRQGPNVYIYEEKYYVGNSISQILPEKLEGKEVEFKVVSCKVDGPEREYINIFFKNLPRLSAEAESAQSFTRYNGDLARFIFDHIDLNIQSIVKEVLED
jgi:hypothetical protein